VAEKGWWSLPRAVRQLEKKPGNEIAEIYPYINAVRRGSGGFTCD